MRRAIWRVRDVLLRAFALYGLLVLLPFVKLGWPKRAKHYAIWLAFVYICSPAFVEPLLYPGLEPPAEYHPSDL